MTVHRTIIHPQTADELVVRLPEQFLNTDIEIIAFSVEAEPAYRGEHTYEQAVKFYRDNAVDFSKIEKWKREDLYE
jgi:hypothetical protein